MDIASLVGMIVCFVLVLYGMIDSAGGISGFGYFVSLPSALITFGGAFCAILMAAKRGGLRDDDVSEHGRLCRRSQEHRTDF